LSVQDAKAVRPGRQFAWQLSCRFANGLVDVIATVALSNVMLRPELSTAWTTQVC
jgi:hypothetical protein